MEDLFVDERWRSGLALLIEDFEIDQHSGIDCDALAEFMSAVAAWTVKLVKDRDRKMPEALNAMERAELAALRKASSLQQTYIESREEAITNLEILLKDAYAQRDRAAKGLAPQ